MAYIPRLSEILYHGLCCKIGTPTVVTIRRDVLDMDDKIQENTSKISKDVDSKRIMLSGSYREGFRFNTSDRDYMMWFCERHFLINDISQLRDYPLSNLDIILMDVTDTPPGFVRLQLLTRPAYMIDFLTSAFVPLNDRIYISSFFLRKVFVEKTGRYNKALDVSNLMKQRLSEHFILYYNKPVDRHRYSEEISNASLSRKMKATWVIDIKFYHRIHFIEELILEQEETKLISLYAEGARYPIFVLVEMLSVLSNYRLGNRSQYLQSLTDLHTLLLYDDGRYVPPIHRDISWQILGICQQVVGDLDGALQSYQESLKQEPRHEIQRATHARIYNIQLSKNRRV
ncbi:uncharacterized protein LOC134259669 [Saccostrea cucullata]|uniref:uncharacterized protein LOC134259669 n=1 Tax=Saccostrea cuccullata TaxID=36930 RepID=UPI002ED63C7F